MHFVTDRQTGRHTDDSIMPIADHTAYDRLTVGEPTNLIDAYYQPRFITATANGHMTSTGCSVIK